ncbi:MAG: hypothetical protein K9J13_05580 [Saprospiraceae bacterium]|nr:hypothetical protein [Saprospiraceae bacterium]
MTKKTFNYNLKQTKTVVYKETTNDIEKIAKEHEADGKKFTSIQKVGRAKTENGVKKEETKQLAIYRKNHGGRNPKYNKTKNG